MNIDRLKFLIKKYLPEEIVNIIRSVRRIIFTTKSKFKINQQDILNLKNIYNTEYVIIACRLFFDQTGSFVWNGGAERYFIDLSEILFKKFQKKVLIVQTICDKSFVHKINDYIDLVTIKNNNTCACSKILNHVITGNNLVITDLSFQDLKNKDRTIFISHGVISDRKASSFSSIYNQVPFLKNIVSVDASTINFITGIFGSKYYKTIKYIPNYVCSENFKKKELIKKDKLTVLFPRRFSPERGFDEMVDIARKILKNHDVNFLFVGHGSPDSMQKIATLVNDYKNNVVCKSLEPDEMNLVYQEADITVIPTQFSEGTSLSCLEAMSSGNVIVATVVGGLSNLIIDNHNGLLCSTLQEDIYNALARVIEDEGLRNKLSKNAIEVSKSFDKKIWEEKWIKYLENFIPYHCGDK